MHACRICKSKTHKYFEALVLNKYTVSYYSCDRCGFLQTDEPYWIDEAYSLSPIASDTAGLLRSLVFAEAISVLIYFCFDRKGIFLDVGGGYGLFTRRMRDIGFDFFWQDRYSPNLFARGFEYDETLGHIEAITSFETFEHFANPIAEIETMFSYSNSIIFTTDILPQNIPKPEEWHYYGFTHGQHISFYSAKTLQYIATIFGQKIYYIPPFHLLTTKKINPALLNTILKLRKLGIFLYIKRRMISKTVTDSIKFANSKMP